MELHGLWGLLELLLESLPLRVLGEKLSITQPAVVGLQATGFSVKRRPKDSKPRTEAHRHHLWETTAAGEEPMRAGRGLKAHGWKEDSWGRAMGLGAISWPMRPFRAQQNPLLCPRVSDLCSKSEETVILWARSDTKIKDVFSLADTELEEKKNLTQMFQIVKFRIKSQISNLF